MSRIGKQPIKVPDGVKVNLDPERRVITVEGPKGKQERNWRPEVSVTWDENEQSIVCSVPESKAHIRQTRAFWGMTRALINTAIIGVSEGYRKELELIGVGWTAKMQGNTLELNVGYCHPVHMPVPEGLTVEVEGNNKIKVSGSDKQAVGQFAANVRSKRPPEPYKGKGLRYVDEYVIRKQGKAFGS